MDPKPKKPEIKPPGPNDMPIKSPRPSEPEIKPPINDPIKPDIEKPIEPHKLPEEKPLKS